MKNKYILIASLLVVVVVGYVSYQNVPSDNNYFQDEVSATINVNETEDQEIAVDTNRVEEVEGTNVEAENYEGTHIMADGTVMAGDGQPLSGASILPDGTIRHSDGTIIVPAFDLRSKTEANNSNAGVPNEVVIDMTGINYDFSVKQIKVKKGDIVTINFVSNEGFHDWVVDEFDAATARVNEGGTTSVTFTADKVGTFQYYCSVGKHRQLGMVGYLIVEER